MDRKIIKDAVIYCRVSSKKQKLEGKGLKSQADRCRDYCEERNYRVTKVFGDDITGSGDFMKRPEMKKLIDYLSKNNHKDFVVVFDDLKRFARDTQFH